MKRLELLGLIYIASLAFFIFNIIFIEEILIFNRYYYTILSTPFYGYMVGVTVILIFPASISSYLYLRLKLRMGRIFGAITAFLVIIILILRIIINIQYSYITSISFSFIILIIAGITSCVIVIRSFILKSKELDIFSIQKTILELSTKFTRLRVPELAEKCSVDDTTIVKVIRNMIKNHEIYADFFKSSQTIAFDQQRNIDELDQLMQTYLKWEKKEFDKQK
jgi:hypothetical protein